MSAAYLLQLVLYVGYCKNMAEFFYYMSEIANTK